MPRLSNRWRKHNQAEATATLESEREANKQLTEELNEQARLLGISAEKELALLAKVEQLERERDRLLKGEHYQHRLCNGWLQVDFDARFVREL